MSEEWRGLGLQALAPPGEACLPQGLGLLTPPPPQLAWWPGPFIPS